MDKVRDMFRKSGACHLFETLMRLRSRSSVIAVMFTLWVGLGPAGAVTLAEIGFRNGVTLHGPHAEFEAYFPLPNGATEANLAVDLTPSAAIDQLSSVTIYVGNEPLATINTRDGSRVVNVTVPIRLAEGDFLRVRFAADQALRRDEQCFDNDNPAVWTHIGPATAVTAAGSADLGVGALWRSLGGSVAIAMPSDPSLADLQTGLILATAITKRGGQPMIVGPDDQRAQILIARGVQPLSAEWRSELVANTPIAINPPPQRGRIVVADPAAARGLVSAGAVLRAAEGGSLLGESRPGLVLSALDSISFAEMGVKSTTFGVYSTALINLEIPFNRLPSGRRPVAIQLFGRGAAPPFDEALVVTLSVGNRLLWSQTYRGSVELDGIRVNLPEDLVRHHMMVSLRVVRVGSKRVCGSDDALMFELRDSTRFILIDGGPNPPNFAAFSMAGDRAALVRFDVSPAAGVPTIPLVARLLSDAGARPAAIDVGGTGTALDRPFIVVAETPPLEIAGNVPARPDLGRVVLERPEDGTRVVLSGAQRFTVVQLTGTNGAAGLWLSPGSRASLARPAPLSAGDVAVFDGAGAQPLSFETRTTGAVVERPSGSVADSLLSRWRSELFVVAWIVVTLFTLLIIMRLRRMRGR